jgi:dihydropteroate synthase
VSVDTWKPEVARAAVAAGARIVNDTGGLRDDAMVEVAATAGVAAVLVHIEGDHPLAVGERELREGRASEVAVVLADRARSLVARGLTDLILDPGLSINYRSDYEAYGRLQLDTIRSLDELKAVGFPVLVPVPRKAQDHRMVAYLTLAIEHGADVIRVHDVDLACDLVTVLGRRLGVAGDR